MNKFRLLPLACSLPVLLSCSAPVGSPPNSANSAMRIEPVLSIRNSDSTARGLYQLGRHYQGQNRLEQAADAYRRALQLHADYIEAHSALGAVYSGQGKFEQAIAELEAALKTAPHLAHIHNNLGYVYYLQGHHNKAIAAFDKAIALEPDNPRAYNNLGAAYHDLGEQQRAQLAFARANALAARLAATPGSAAGDAPPAVAGRGERSPDSIPLTNPAAPIALQTVAAGPSTALEATSRVFASGEPAVVAAAPTTPAASIASPAVAVVEWSEPSVAAPAFAAAELAVVPAASTTPAATIASSASAAVASNEPSVGAAAEHRESVPAATADRRFRMEIANGNGVRGLARRVGATLASQGFAPSHLTNQKPYQQLETTVRYRDGFHDDALRISQQFSKPTRLVSNVSLRDTVDVQLVLGRDVTSNVALFRSSLAPVKLAKKVVPVLDEKS